MGLVVQRGGRGKLAAIAIGAVILVNCGLFDDEEGRVALQPFPDLGMSFSVAPSSLGTEFEGRVKTRVSVYCPTCVSGAPRVVELPAESAIIGFVSAPSVTHSGAIHMS